MTVFTAPRPDGNGVYIADGYQPERQHDMSVKVIDGEVRISMRDHHVSLETLRVALMEAELLSKGIAA